MMKRVLLTGCLLLLASSMVLASTFEGRVVWHKRLELSSLVSGRIARIPVVQGERVARGTLLLEFEQRAIAARLQAARVRLKFVRETRQEARRELERSLELYERTLLSDHEKQLDEIAFAKAEAAFAQAEAELAQAELEQNYSRLKAPFDALIVELLVQPGQLVVNRLNTVPLLVLAASGEMQAVLQLDLEQLHGLQVGARARVVAAQDEYPGRIVRIGLEPVKGAGGESKYPVEVVFGLPEKGGLRAGMPVRVIFDEN